MASTATGPALWRELGASGEYVRLVRSPVWRGEGVPRGAGEPVILIPGFLSPDGLMRTMAGWLGRMGYRPARARMGGLNADCGEAGVLRLERRVERVAERAGRKVAVVGHSRGGHYARVLAVRRPDLISGIVTLGAPPLDHQAIHPLVRIPPILLTALGSAGVPGLFRKSCFLGDCCLTFRHQLHAEFPSGVGFVAVVSRTDGIVDYRRLTEWAADRIEVEASHLGIVVNPEAYAALGVSLPRFR